MNDVELKVIQIFFFCHLRTRIVSAKIIYIINFLFFTLRIAGVESDYSQIRLVLLFFLRIIAHSLSLHYKSLWI